MSDRGLSIASEKSEAIILTRRKIVPTINISVGEHVISVVLEAKYLGTTFDPTYIPTLRQKVVCKREGYYFSTRKNHAKFEGS